MIVFWGGHILRSRNIGTSPTLIHDLLITAKDRALDPWGRVYNQKLRAGQGAEADRREWNDYARKRDLSPNIEGQRVYRLRRPRDKNDIVVEIKAGAESRIQIEVFSR